MEWLLVLVLVPNYNSAFDNKEYLVDFDTMLKYIYISVIHPAVHVHYHEVDEVGVTFVKKDLKV